MEPTGFAAKEDFFIDVSPVFENKDGAAHWNSGFSVFLFTRGSGTQIINGASYSFRPGTIVALSPIDFHQCVCEGDFEAETMIFSAGVFYRKLINLCPISAFPLIADLSPDDFQKSDRLFKMLIDETAFSDNCSDLIKSNLVEQIFLFAFNNAPGIKDASKDSADPLLNSALMYIYRNFKSNISAEDVASGIHYSTGYFNKMFKKSTGQSFHKYLCDLRLRFAYNLLKQGNLPVFEVCSESGFHSVQNFSSLFKKRYGCSPGDVR